MKSTVIALATVATIANGMSGEEACENRGLNQQRCAAVGCCHWNPSLGCMSSVGPAQCHDSAGKGGIPSRFGANGAGRPPMQGGPQGNQFGGNGRGRRQRGYGRRRATGYHQTHQAAGNQPSHKELKDLARMTEENIMENSNVEEVMMETGLDMKSLEEYSFDLMIDMVSSLPDEEFLKLQIDILEQRLGEVKCVRDDEGNCADGPSITSVVDDMTYLTGEYGSRRRMEKKPWTFWVDFSSKLISGLLGTVGALGAQFTNNNQG